VKVAPLLRVPCVGFGAAFRVGLGDETAQTVVDDVAASLGLRALALLHLIDLVEIGEPILGLIAVIAAEVAAGWVGAVSGRLANHGQPPAAVIGVFPNFGALAGGGGTHGFGDDVVGISVCRYPSPAIGSGEYAPETVVSEVGRR